MSNVSIDFWLPVSAGIFYFLLGEKKESLTMAGKILAASAILVLLFSCMDNAPKSRGAMATDFTLQDLNGGGTWCSRR